MSLRQLTEEFRAQEAILREGGGKEGQARQARLGRLTVRERLNLLLDPEKPFLEWGLWAAYGMYAEWGTCQRPASSQALDTVSRRRLHDHRQ